MVRFAINISTYMIIYVCLLLLVGVPSTANASAGTSFDSSSPFVTGPITVGLGMPGPAPRSLAARTADVVNVKDYYARGDSKGTRPSDEGVDISNEPWNNWTKYPFYTDKIWSPYWISGTFKPPRPTPFSSTDTWDSIGINLALWNAKGSGGVFLPAGGYSINVAEAPIIFMKGMSSSIRGAGMYHTTIGTLENASFFGKSAGQQAKYNIILAYRAGGPPTYIEDMCISGPMGYQSSFHNLVGIRMENTNGFYFKGIWFTAYEAGLWLVDHSGDCFVDECAGEYNFGGMLHFADDSCDCFVRNSNLWASSSDRYQYGIYSNGSPVKLAGSKLVGYAGAGVYAGGAPVDVQSNQFDGCAIGVQASGGGSIISNNAFNGRGSSVLNGTALISTAKQLAPGVGGFVGSFVINGNRVEDGSASQNPIVLLAHEATGTLSGNAFHKWDVSGGDTSGFIIDVEEGEGAAAVGMLVSSNSFRAAGQFAGSHAISPDFKGTVANNIGA